MKREMNCFPVYRLGCWLVCAGFAVLPIGALARWMGFGDSSVFGILCCGWLRSRIIALIAVKNWKNRTVPEGFY